MAVKGECPSITGMSQQCSTRLMMSRTDLGIWLLLLDRKVVGGSSSSKLGSSRRLSSLAFMLGFSMVEPAV
jgi:hypothetical protein